MTAHLQAPCAALAVPLALALALTSATPPAHAGRPFATEDAGVLQPRECEWEAAHERIRPAEGPRAHGTTVQLGCGLTPVRAQVAVSVEQASDGQRRDTAAGLGAKWLLWAPFEDASVALAAGTAAERNDAGRRRFDQAVVLAVGSLQAVPGWTLHAHAGVQLRRHERRTSLWALALEHAVTDRWMVGAETYRDEEASRWNAAVLRWQAADAWSLDVSIGRQRGGAARGFSVGGKWVF